MIADLNLSDEDWQELRRRDGSINLVAAFTKIFPAPERKGYTAMEREEEDIYFRCREVACEALEMAESIKPIHSRQVAAVVIGIAARNWGIYRP
jgi:streptomycin 6-kinase